MISGIGSFSGYAPLTGGYTLSQSGAPVGNAQETAKEQKEKEQKLNPPPILGEGTEKSAAQNTYSPQGTQNTQADTSQGQSDTQDADEKKQQSLPADERAPSGEELSEEDKAQVQELKKRDAEVRAHEQAHLAAAGSLAQGGASFDYQSGPDGNRYAVGGEVSIDTSKVAGDPAATIAKAQRIRRAALAPAEPSSTDRSVASQASSMEAQARKELAQEKQEEAKVEANPENSSTAATSNSTSGSEGSSGAPTQASNQSSSITDFYKNIQGAGAANQGISQLDIFA